MTIIAPTGAMIPPCCATHPKDEPGKELIRRVFQVAHQLKQQIPIVYLENYDVELVQLLTASVDLWLNTPLPPLEASGTSGMKAAHNGVPSFSVLDGWWMEGHIEGVTGWSIGPCPTNGSQMQGTTTQVVEELCHKLRTVISPLFYRDRDKWMDVMRQTIAFNASFFNTHRMVQQYAANACLRIRTERFATMTIFVTKLPILEKVPYLSARL